MEKGKNGNTRQEENDALLRQFFRFPLFPCFPFSLITQHFIRLKCYGKGNRSQGTIALPLAKGGPTEGGHIFRPSRVSSRQRKPGRKMSQSPGGERSLRLLR